MTSASLGGAKRHKSMSRPAEWGRGRMAQFSRREFLSCCSLLALCAAGCRLLPRARLARFYLNDPHPEDYQPVLRALVEAILPFDHPRFPSISAQRIEARFLKLFDLEEEERFLIIQQTFLFFNEIDLFPQTFPSIVAEERRLLDAGPDRVRPPDFLLSEKELHDGELYRKFRSTTPSSARHFTHLSLQLKRQYLGLWGSSGFAVKRRFYSSAKDLVVVTAYTMDEVWRAIGYEGPLLGRT